MKEYKLPIGCDVPETIILADGDFPSHPLALEWLRQCPYVVCCDGAANTYIRSGRMPEAIVGDGDSLLPDIKERYASLIHSEAEQETNDLSKAFSLLPVTGEEAYYYHGGYRKKRRSYNRECQLAGGLYGAGGG